MPFIYKIYNDVNNKVYIGKTSNTIEDRWNEHVYAALYRRQRRNYQLYNAMRKYGVDKFHIIALEECTENDLTAKEIYWIQKYNSFNNGYNMTIGGDGTIFYSRDQILQYWNQGYTQLEIAKIMGCCRQTVAHALKVSGISDTERSKYKGKRNNIKKLGE